MECGFDFDLRLIRLEFGYFNGFRIMVEVVCTDLNGLVVECGFGSV